MVAPFISRGTATEPERRLSILHSLRGMGCDVWHSKGPGKLFKSFVWAVRMVYCTKDIRNDLRAIIPWSVFFNIFILVLSSRGLLGTVEHRVIASIFFLSLNFGALAVYVVPSAISPGLASEAEGKPDVKALKGLLFKSPITALFVYMLAMTTLPNIAPHVGELPLRLLNVGGGVERLFYASSKAAEDIPAEILEVYSGKIRPHDISTVGGSCDTLEFR